MSPEQMVKERKGSKKVVIYEHANGVIFIHPTTREPSGRHKTNSELVEYGNVKDTIDRGTLMYLIVRSLTMFIFLVNLSYSAFILAWT